MYVQLGKDTIKSCASAARNGKHNPLVLLDPAHLHVCRVVVVVAVVTQSFSVSSRGVSSEQRTPVVI